MDQTPKMQNPAGGPGFAQSGFNFSERSKPTTTRTMPKPGTARMAVLEALLSGRTLTSLEAWREFGTSRLAADVFELKRMGWPIVAAEAPVACREGRSARVAFYKLAQTHVPA